MALRIASLLGAGCLSQQLGHVLGEEKEYFPLSGGIDDGVEVEVKFDAIQDSAAKIEFVDRERKAAFRFEIDKTRSTVTRSSSAEFSDSTETETFGGFASDFVSGAPTLKFTKRRHEIAVSIDGVRFPWYDYSNRKLGDSAPLLTHFAVFSGLTNPEVTLRRPTCATKCNVNECLDSNGDSLCPDGNCFSVVMSATPGVAASCSAATETSPGTNSHCCDGDDAPPPARSSLAVGKYATLGTNSAYLTRVCSAFNSCGNEEPTSTVTAEAFPGAQVEVKTEADADGLFTVFIPQSLDKAEAALPASTQFKVPRFAIYQSFKVQKMQVDVESEDLVLTTQFAVNHFNDIITASDGFIKDLGVKKGWFVYLAAYDFLGKKRLSKYTDRTQSFWRGKRENRTLWLSDQPVTALTSCTDLPMTDDEGNSDACATYNVDPPLCTIHGDPTPAGCEHFGLGEGCTRLPAGKDDQTGVRVNPDGAAALCCACGGGLYEAPADWEVSRAQQVLFK